MEAETLVSQDFAQPCNYIHYYVHRAMERKTTWGRIKRGINIRDHHIDFIDLEEVFDGRFCLVKRDERKDYGEERYNMLVEFRGFIINVTFTTRAGKYRLISARPASRKERTAYGQHQQQA